MEVRNISTDEIPDTIIPEARVFIKDVVDKLKADPALKDTSYGHGAAALAQIAAGVCKDSPEQQRTYLKEAANNLIAKYGLGMIDFMRPELREALNLEKKK